MDRRDLDVERGRLEEGRASPVPGPRDGDSDKNTSVRERERDKPLSVVITAHGTGATASNQNTDTSAAPTGIAAVTQTSTMSTTERRDLLGDTDTTTRVSGGTASSATAADIVPGTGAVADRASIGAGSTYVPLASVLVDTSNGSRDREQPFSSSRLHIVLPTDTEHRSPQTQTTRPLVATPTAISMVLSASSDASRTRDLPPPPPAQSTDSLSDGNANLQPASRTTQQGQDRNENQSQTLPPPQRRASQNTAASPQTQSLARPVSSLSSLEKSPISEIDHDVVSGRGPTMGLQRRSTGTGTTGIVPPPQAILIGGQGQGGYGNGGGYGGGYGNGGLVGGGGVDRGSAVRRGSYGLNAGAGMPVPVPVHTHTQPQANPQMAERERASRLFWAGDGTGTGGGGAGGGGGPPPGGGGGGGLLDEFVPTRQAQPGEIPVIPERTVERRLKPTLEAARAERSKYSTRAKATGYALNIAIGLQVLISALITGLSAVTTGRNTSIMTSILGGLGTIVASYLARARGSNEPELSISRTKDLEKFIRSMEAYIEDHGDEIGHAHDQRIDEIREEFEQLLGNASGERKMAPPV